jgi:hypothetical protein
LFPSHYLDPFPFPPYFFFLFWFVFFSFLVQDRDKDCPEKGNHWSGKWNVRPVQGKGVKAKSEMRPGSREPGVLPYRVAAKLPSTHVSKKGHYYIFMITPATADARHARQGQHTC